MFEFMISISSNKVKIPKIMENKINTNKHPEYWITDSKQFDQMIAIGRALSSIERINILNLILTKPMTIKELSDCLNLPISSVTQHTNVLSEAKLINIEYKPNKKGFVKVCSKSINTMRLIFDDTISDNSKNELFYEMPIGNFSEINIIPPCGMAGKHSSIGDFDELSSFYLPTRSKAELLWFSNGNISYKFPNSTKENTQIDSISFSLEICSETLYSRNDWPSDITFWINGQEILTWTSPGDFGGRRGKFTPEYWFINSTQYGMLKNIHIDSYGVYLDNVLVNNTLNVSKLNLNSNKYIEFKIGIKPDAVHKGGINIFGKNFGDHKQSIIMKLTTSLK